MKAFLLSIFLVGCTGGIPAHQGVVKSVGGCDKYGDCAVLLEDGRMCMAHFPVATQKVECCPLTRRGYTPIDHMCWTE